MRTNLVNRTVQNVIGNGQVRPIVVGNVVDAGSAAALMLYARSAFRGAKPAAKRPLAPAAHGACSTEHSRSCRLATSTCRGRLGDRGSQAAGRLGSWLDSTRRQVRVERRPQAIGDRS